MHAVRPGGDLRILDPAGDLLRGKPRGRRAGRGIGLGVQPGLQQRAPGQGGHVDAHPGIVKGAGQSANALKMSVFRIQHLAAAIPLRIVFQVHKGILRHIEGKAHLVGRCFGGDFGQIIYDFGTEGKGKLLLVASSYSNPINALIAAGYDQTYVVDLRYYQEWAGKPFDPVSYCEENGIGTVLLLGDVNLFFVDGPEEGGE